MGERKKPELIIFDMDGTLVDSEPASIECWITALKEAGFEAEFKDIIPFIGKNMKLIKEEAEIRWVGADFLSIYKRQKELMEKNHKNGATLKPGALKALKLINDLGIRACVATSSTKKRAETIIKSLNLENEFEFIITGEDVVNSKPDPEIFQICFDKSGVLAENSIVIEDSKNGIIAGRRSLAKTVLIPDLITPDEEMRLSADYLFSNMDEFSDWLMKKYGEG